MNAIIGANGLVGNALSHFLDGVGTYRNCKDNLIEGKKYEYLDITDGKKVDEFFETYKPKRVFLSAANPWVDGCENPDTDKTNILGMSHIISNCHIHSSQLVFFSSSYVFDGESQVPYKTKDETFPINRYGRQKEQIERIIKNREGLQWLIIRTVGVFGHEGTPKNFVAQIRRAVKENKKVHVPTDQTMNPIWSMDLARIAIKLSDRYSGEVFHVAGDKCLSKYEFAINVAYKLGCKKPHELVVGMKSTDMRQLANRPKNGCLDCGQLQARAMSIPNFEKGLWKFLTTEYGIESRQPIKSS
jgi:dTDP-4-dehydrorhamnose reductase